VSVPGEQNLGTAKQCPGLPFGIVHAVPTLTPLQPSVSLQAQRPEASATAGIAARPIDRTRAGHETGPASISKTADGAAAAVAGSGAGGAAGGDVATDAVAAAGDAAWSAATPAAAPATIQAIARSPRERTTFFDRIRSLLSSVLL
jgi:hypothetical protein